MTKDIKYIIKRVIIGVLISIILMFIGSFKVNALDTYMLPFYQSICPNGTVYNYGEFRGCHNNPSNYSLYLQFNNNGNIPEGFYDLGFSIQLRGSQNFAISIKDVSCSINGTGATNINTTSTGGAQYYFAAGQFYTVRCENVPITNGVNQLYVLVNSIIATDNYFYINIYNSVVPRGFQSINDSINNVNDSINNVNDSIKSEESPSNEDLDSILNNKSNNNNVANLIMFVPNIFASVGSGLSSNCSGSIQLGNLMGTNLVLTCIRPQNYLGSTLWTIIDFMFLFGLFLAFRTWIVNIYNDLTSLKEVHFN